MAIVINSNIQSLNAQRNLLKSSYGLNKSMERLSSGLRINSASDDAAGLAISNRMTAQIRGLDQAVRNTNDGISLAQTAEGALQESTNVLQRMREIAVQASSGTLAAADRTSLNDEYGELVSELDRISSTTTFNGIKLLDGTFDADIQVGANAGETINIAIGNADSSTLMGAVGDVTTAANATTELDAIDTALAGVDSIRGNLGAKQNRFQSTIANLSNISENLSSARSRIMDADIAQETSNMTKFNILQQAGVSVLAQANQMPSLALSLLG